MSKELNEKQKAFCQEYIIDLNATQAAIRSGYSEKTARQIASDHLSKVNIQDYIQSLMDKRSKRVNIDADDVLGSIKDIREECRKGKNHKDALKANELLGKHLKLFTDKVEHQNPDGSALAPFTINIVGKE